MSSEVSKSGNVDEIETTLDTMSTELKKEQMALSDDIGQMKIETLVPLPRVNIKEPLISAKIKSPDFIMAGEPFPYVLVIKNNTGLRFEIINCYDK